MDNIAEALGLLAAIAPVAIDELKAWLIANEEQFDLVTVWALVLGLYVLFGVKLASWAVIRYQQPITPVGIALRGQKLSEAVFYFAWGTVYTGTLILYYSYPGEPFGIWVRMLLRSMAVAGIAGAVIHGLRFSAALRFENWGRPSLDRK